MSGYLQRMAAAAVTPQRRVHPVVRPLYEPASEPVKLPLAVVTERVSERVSEPVSRRLSETSPLLSREGEAFEESRVSETADRRVGRPADQPAGGAAPGDRFEALLPEVAQKASAGPEHASLHNDASRDESFDAQKRDPRWNDIRPDRTRRFEPLLKEVQWQANGADEESARPARYDNAVAHGDPSLVPREYYRKSAEGQAAGVNGMQKTAALAVGRRLEQQAIARVARGDEEIQIHIGRIEVTAMPPAAPRPVPAPVRKSQTLDEYLRQRNGRAG